MWLASSSTIAPPPPADAAAAALRIGGHLTIVSDNAWYAEQLFEALDAHGAFEGARGGGAARPAGARVVRAGAAARGGARRAVELVCAKPGAWCGHAADGASSYFDRLWQTGLSAHSAVHERYVLHVARRA